jgi:hypothetical protein
VGRLSSGTQANIFRSIAGYRAQVIDKTNATAAAAAPGFSALPAADQAAIQKRASAKPTFPSVGSSSGGVQGVDIKGE